MKNTWRHSLHIPFMFLIQLLFFILFGLFARYDPKYAMKNTLDHGHYDEKNSNHQMGKTYSMFQDVHVMIFIGFGFLMTFLKKYGLSAVSLNMLCSVLAIQWSILIHGFFHPHCEDPTIPWADCPKNYGYVDINITTLLSADFATAAVLISFGVVIGTTNPIQLLFMTFSEIVFYNINEFIGRDLIKAVDAGDTIFVHMFGAYFGLAASRMLYVPAIAKHSEKASASYISDLFSMIGTIFLWMFWPSFNAGGAAEGDAQQRAVINTYLSLCAAVMASFSASAFFSPDRKFCMEHIQNATLAGGVAVGACADMIITPAGSLVVGFFAGVISTWGFSYLSPLLKSKLKTLDTCGVNNLHGMPSLLGGMLSVLLAGIATPDMYDHFGDSGKNNSLIEIFPQRVSEPGWGGGKQAGMQMASIVITLTIAVSGGVFTGYVMKMIGKNLSMRKPGVAISHLVAATRKITVSSAVGYNSALTPDLLYDDNAYFHVEDEH